MDTIATVDYVSIEVVLEAPAWSGPYDDEQLQRFERDNLFGAAALLVGRVTHRGFHGVGDGLAGDTRRETASADRTKGITEHVASRSDVKLEWNARVLGGDLVEAVSMLQATDHQHVDQRQRGPGQPPRQRKTDPRAPADALLSTKFIQLRDHLAYP